MFSFRKALNRILRGIMRVKFNAAATPAMPLQVIEPVPDVSPPPPPEKAAITTEFADPFQPLLAMNAAQIIAFANDAVIAKRPDEALNALEYCVQNGHKEPEVLFTLAVSYDLAKDAKKAAEYAVEALKGDPDNIKFQCFYADVIPLVHDDCLQMAEMVYQNLLEKRPNDAYVHFRYARFLVQRMDCPGLAKEYLEGARLMLKPGSAEPWLCEMGPVHNEITTKLTSSYEAWQIIASKLPVRDNRKITGIDPRTRKPLDDIWNEQSPS